MYIYMCTYVYIFLYMYVRIRIQYTIGPIYLLFRSEASILQIPVEPESNASDLISRAPKEHLNVRILHSVSKT